MSAAARPGYCNRRAQESVCSARRSRAAVGSSFLAAARFQLPVVYLRPQ
jgi:hypothetical protein